MVGIAEELPLKGPGRDVWPLHGKCDAVGGDEDEDDKIEPVWEAVEVLECRCTLPSLGGELLAEHPRPAAGAPDVEGIGVPLTCKLPQLLQEALLLRNHFGRHVWWCHQLDGFSQICADRIHTGAGSGAPLAWARLLLVKSLTKPCKKIQWSSDYCNAPSCSFCCSRWSYSS